MTGNLSPKRASKHARAVDRAMRAYGLRVIGLPWEDIAREVGYSPDKYGANAIRAVRRVLGSVPALDMEMRKSLWRDRLELLWQEGWQDVQENRPGAISAATKVAQRAAQLDGLDAQPAYASPAAEVFEQVVRRTAAVLTSGQPQEADIFAEVIDEPEIEEK